MVSCSNIDQMVLGIEGRVEDACNICKQAYEGERSCTSLPRVQRAREKEKSCGQETHSLTKDTYRVTSMIPQRWYMDKQGHPLHEVVELVERWKRGV